MTQKQEARQLKRLKKDYLKGRYSLEEFERYCELILRGEEVYAVWVWVAA